MRLDVRVPADVGGAQVRPVDRAYIALADHMKRHAGSLLTEGAFASEEFDRLYLAWIRARWDDGDAWTRSVWRERP